jgi:hypothetical protein
MDAEKGGTGQETFAHVFSPVKGIKGSGREIVDPLESIVYNTHLVAQAVAKQEVSNALARWAKQEGAGFAAERIPTPVKRVRISPDEVQAMLKKAFKDDPEIQEALEGILGTVDADAAAQAFSVFRPINNFRGKNLISVLEDGHRAWYEVDPEMYRALAGLDREQVDGVVRALNYPVKWLRAGATLAPEFIFRNPIRDVVMASIQSKSGFNPADFFRGLGHLIKKDDLYWKWKAGGGEFATLVDMDRDGMRMALEELRRSGDKIPNVVRSPLAALQALSASMENATRLGEFGKAVQKGQREGLKGRELYQAAGYEARDVSIDFDRHGAGMTSLRILSAFWNARVQGYNKLWRAAKENPAKFSALALSYITVPSVLEYAANRNDPEYFEIPRWQRDLFWVFKVNDQWIRVPKPFELGFVFGTVPQRMLEAVDDKSPGGGRGLATALKDWGVDQAMGFAPVPTAVQPMVENLANRDLFLQRPIVSRGQEDIEPYLQYGRRTSEFAKWVGGMTNYSPAKIDNLFHDWTGGLGRYASQGTTAAARMAGLTEEKGERPAGTLSDLPVVRGFTFDKPGADAESVQRFYEDYGETTQKKATFDYLLRSGDAKRLPDYARKNMEAIATNRGERAVAGVMAQLRDYARRIEEHPTMSAQEKRRKMDEIGARMREIGARMQNR